MEVYGKGLSTASTARTTVSESVVQVQGIPQFPRMCLHYLLGLQILKPDSACKELKANTTRHLLVLPCFLLASFNSLACCFHVCFLGPDNTCSEYLTDGFGLGLLPPPPPIFCYLSKGAGSQAQLLLCPYSPLTASLNCSQPSTATYFMLDV